MSLMHNRKKIFLAKQVQNRRECLNLLSLRNASEKAFYEDKKKHFVSL